MQVRAGYQLISEGDQDVCMYFVVTGNLHVFQTVPETSLDDQKEVRCNLCVVLPQRCVFSQLYLKVHLSERSQISFLVVYHLCTEQCVHAGIFY